MSRLTSFATHLLLALLAFGLQGCQTAPETQASNSSPTPVPAHILYGLPTVPMTVDDITDDPINLIMRYHYGSRERILKRRQLIGLAMSNEAVRAQLVASVMSVLQAGGPESWKDSPYRALRDLRAIDALPVLQAHWEEQDKVVGGVTDALHPRIQLLDALATLQTGRGRNRFLIQVLYDKEEHPRARCYALLLLARIGGEEGADQVGKWLDGNNNVKGRVVLSADQRMAADTFLLYTRFQTRGETYLLETQSYRHGQWTDNLLKGVELTAKDARVIPVTNEQAQQWWKDNPEKRPVAQGVSVQPDTDLAQRQQSEFYDLNLQPGDRCITLVASRPGSFASEYYIFRKINGRWLPIYIKPGDIT